MQVNQTQLADVFGVEPRTVRLWDKDGLPRVGNGTGGAVVYETADAYRWLVAREVAKVAGESLDWNKERTRLAKEQADKTALQNAKARGDLLEFDTVVEWWTKLIGAARVRFMSFPSRLRQAIPDCGDREYEIATDLTREVLEELATMRAGDLACGSEADETETDD